MDREKDGEGKFEGREEEVRRKRDGWEKGARKGREKEGRREGGKGEGR